MKLAPLVIPLMVALLAAAPQGARGRVAGHVSDENGLQLPNAQVRLTRLDPELGALSYSTMRSARVDDLGNYEFSRVEPGTYLVDAQCGELWLPLPVKIALAGDDPPITDLTLSLRKGAAIEGQVLDENGAPLAGVGVGVGDAGLQGGLLEPVIVIDHRTGEASALARGLTYPRLPLATAFTDADGHFRLAPVLPASAASLRVGGLAEYFDTTISGIVVRGAKTSFVDVALKRAAAILGRVTFDDGRPAAGAQLTLRTIECEPQSRSWIVLTKSNGSSEQARTMSSTTITVGNEGLFRFDGLTPGRYLLRVVAPSMATYTSSVLLVSRDAETVSAQVALEPARSLRGRVADGNGIAARAGVVRVLVDDSVPEGLQPFVEPAQAQVARDGSFTVEGLGSGPYDVEVVCPGHPPVFLDQVLPDTENFMVDLGHPAPRLATPAFATHRAPAKLAPKAGAKTAKAKPRAKR